MLSQRSYQILTVSDTAGEARDDWFLMVEDNTDRPPALLGKVSWRLIAAFVFLLSGLAAGMALHFTITSKSQVFLQMLLAYSLVFALILIYFVAYETAQRLMKGLTWLTLLLFIMFLSFIHLDDLPARPIHTAELGLVERSEAPQLRWVALLNLSSATILSLHFFWLGQGKRTPKKPAARD